MCECLRIKTAIPKTVPHTSRSMSISLTSRNQTSEMAVENQINRCDFVELMVHNF